MRAGHYSSSSPVTFGGPVEFPGVLDEVRVLNRARTAAEIYDTWFGTSTASGSNLNSVKKLSPLFAGRRASPLAPPIEILRPPRPPWETLEFIRGSRASGGER